MGRDGGDRPEGHLKRSLLVAAALAALVALGLGLYADFGDLVHALGRFRWEFFPLALALTATNYLIRFWRWQIYLARLELQVPAWRSFTIFLAGLTMTISPAKLGEVLKSGLLRRSFELPVRRTAPIVLAERVTDALGIVVLVAVGAVWAGGWEYWPLPAFALAATLALVALLRLDRLQRFVRLAEARLVALRLLDARLLVLMSLLAAVSWFFECLSAYACVRGLRLDVSLADTIVVFSLATLAGAVSFLPGGLGVAETSMTGLWRVFADVPKASAAAATVLVRLATLWFAVVLGLAALAVEERLSSSSREGAWTSGG